ncbi:MAG: glycosyltransferase family 4 protein [archaeon]
MKIVCICQYYAYPPRQGGQIRVYNLNKRLNAVQHSFTPVLNKTATLNKGYAEHIYSLKSFTAVLLFLKFLGIRSYDFLIPSLFRHVRPPAPLLSDLKDADIVQVEHPWLVAWIAKFTDKPIVLVAHNIEHNLARDIFRSHPLGKRITESVRHTEQEAISLASMVFCVCEEDKTELRSLYGKKRYCIIPNGVDTRIFTPKKRDPSFIWKKVGKKFRHIVLFTGSRHPPNEEALESIRSLAEKMKDIFFVVAGHVAQREVRGNMFCTGDIGDILPYFQAADIAINPMLSGSGTNLKLLEYMASGLPAVTTPKGARGIRVSDGVNACVSEIWDFERAIRALLGDATLRKKLSINARKAAREYSWDLISAEAYDALASLGTLQ